jgi:cobalt-zinc-cadmium efflux system outer membrane protein
MELIMITEHHARAMAGAAMLLLLSGCASSLRDDVASVRKLSHTQAALPRLREGHVDADVVADTRATLAKPLDAEAAVRVALLNNRELRARLRELGVASARVLEAGLVANPIFEAELLPERDSDLELRVEYEITSLIMAPMKRRAEQHELEAARLDVAGDVIQLGYEVRTAFYAVQTAEQRLAFAQQTLEALSAGRDAAAAIAAAGNAPQLNVAGQTVGYERARITVAQLELEVASLREAFQRLLGLHGEYTEWKVDAAVQPVPEQVPSTAEIERKALEANLELRAAHKRLDALARRTGVARTQGFLPEVALDVHTLRTDEEDSGGDEWRWGGGVSVEVPLFDHGQGERRGYEAQFDALLERYQGLAIDLRSNARETSNRLRSAHARARQYEAVILPAQTTVMEQTLLQYNAMQLGIFQLLEARRELLDVQLAYADTVREYWSAQAEYEALLSGRMVKAASAAAPVAMGGSGSAAGGH